MIEEIYRDIKGYEGYYQVSNLGNVRSLERVVDNNGGSQIREGKVLKNHINRYRNNYRSVMLSKNGKTQRLKVHRLVAFAFPEICGEWFEGAEVDHVDTDTSNNIATNLRWVSKKDNMRNPLTRDNCSKAYTEERRKRYSERMKINNPMKKSA